MHNGGGERARPGRSRTSMSKRTPRSEANPADPDAKTTPVLSRKECERRGHPLMIPVLGGEVCGCTSHFELLYHAAPMRPKPPDPPRNPVKAQPPK